jgi:DNA-binding NtrC family response regulator
MPDVGILIVDDDYASRLLISKILEKEKYEIVQASNGFDALTLLRKKSFDLVISDLRMDGMNGIELLQKARQIDPTLAVIILTGHASMQTAIDAVRLGAIDYLMKPINSDELRVRVKKSIERVQLEKRLSEIERQMTYSATVTTANHEINQPLTVILSGIDMIKMEYDKKGNPDEKIVKYLNLIEKSSIRIAGILRNLREISSPVIQKIPLGMRMVDLKPQKKGKHFRDRYILLVEDEEQIRILVHDMLESAGYKVILSSNAEEGIEIFKGQQDLIDLILLDYYLPDGSGLDVLRKIKEIDDSTKVLITSGFELHEDIEKAIEEGAIGFISKPFNREQIINMIQQIID